MVPSVCLWNAVLTYIQLFEDIFKYLKISSNELKISSNELKISSNELKISLNISELQIIFESNAYLRPNFWLNADFQISKSIFNPCNFSQCWKGRYYCFGVPYLNFFWCNFNYSFDSDLLLLVITLEFILTICWQTDRQIDIDNPEFFFCFKKCIDNQYALHWTPNAYRNMLMRIFTPSLYFQCVFNDFQCVITLLRALSVALQQYDVILE